MGYLRFFLSLVVATSDMPGGKLPINIAACAVIVFYFLSGYVMSFKFAALKNAGAFYKNRFFTIFPAYATVAIVTFIIVSLLGPSNTVRFFANGFTGSDLLNALALFPLHYSFDPFSYRSNLIPPAWSLATEAHFYLLAPLLFPRPRLMLAAFVASATLHFYALTQAVGPINADNFGYRFFPSMLAVFLFGALMASQQQRWHQIGRGYWIGYIAILAFAGSAFGMWQMQITAEIILGLVLTVPLLTVALAIQRTRTDAFFGKIAYPVFLVHSLCIYLVEKAAGNLPQWAFIFASICLTVAVSFLIAEIQVRYISPRTAIPSE